MPRRTKIEETPAQTDPMTVIMATNGETMETAMESQRAVWDSMTVLGQEMMDFMSRRLHEDMETSRSLMACKTPKEAFQVQCRFAETATRAYFDEAQKVMELAGRVARAGWVPVERHTEKALKDMSNATE